MEFVYKGLSIDIIDNVINTNSVAELRKNVARRVTRALKRQVYYNTIRQGAKFTQRETLAVSYEWGLR